MHSKKLSFERIMYSNKRLSRKSAPFNIINAVFMYQCMSVCSFVMLRSFDFIYLIYRQSVNKLLTMRQAQQQSNGKINFVSNFIWITADVDVCALRWQWCGFQHWQTQIVPMILNTHTRSLAQCDWIWSDHTLFYSSCALCTSDYCLKPIAYSHSHIIVSYGFDT